MGGRKKRMMTGVLALLPLSPSIEDQEEPEGQGGGHLLSRNGTSTSFLGLVGREARTNHTHGLIIFPQFSSRIESRKWEKDGGLRGGSPGGSRLLL